MKKVRVLEKLLDFVARLPKKCHTNLKFHPGGKATRKVKRKKETKPKEFNFHQQSKKKFLFGFLTTSN